MAGKGVNSSAPTRCQTPSIHFSSLLTTTREPMLERSHLCKVTPHKDSKTCRISTLKWWVPSITDAMRWRQSRERTLWTQIQGTISELKISAVLFIILIFKELKAWEFRHWAKGHSHARSVAQSCPTLCDPMDCSPLGSSDHGILQTRILEWVAMPSSRGSSQPRDWTWILCTADGYFTAEPPGKPQAKDPTTTKQWGAMCPGQKATPPF